MSHATARATTRQYTHHVNGRSHASGDDVIQRHSPADGTLVAEFADGNVTNAEAAVAAARSAFDDGEWSRLTGVERGRLLFALADAIRSHAALLADIEVAETGKPIRVARDDIDGAIGHTESAGSLAWQLHGDSHTDLAENFTALTVREPVGVAGLIVPWNFPTLILMQKLGYALAAGCTAVVKPSEFTSGTAMEVAELASKVGFPPGVVNVVTGRGPVVGAHLVADPKVDLVSFTGSTATGRQVVQASAGDLKRVSLELGGKAANIAFDDADLDDAIDGVLFGAYFNQGECCVAGSRLLVAHGIADDFLARLTDKAQRLRIGDPFDEATDVGPLIHRDHLDKVLTYVAAGRDDGATVLTGGERVTGDRFDRGHFVHPTIFDGVDPATRLFREEIFGPVLTVTRFHDVAEATTLANDTVYGLANSLWSKNIDTALDVARRLRSGTVWVNTTLDAKPQLPFGGYKQSGYGREMGQMGVDEFTNTKSIQIRTGKRVPQFSV